jgi:hypothetical protein
MKTDEQLLKPITRYTVKSKIQNHWPRETTLQIFLAGESLLRCSIVRSGLVASEPLDGIDLKPFKTPLHPLKKSI